MELFYMVMELNKILENNLKPILNFVQDFCQIYKRSPLTILYILYIYVGGVRRSPTQVLTRVTCNQRSRSLVIV